MSEHRKASYALQVQHGPAGSKITRIEIFPARLWLYRPSFQELYPSEVWADLYRVRVDGRWWWLNTKEGEPRYPFFTHPEAWRVISAYAAALVGIVVPEAVGRVPELRKEDRVIAMVDGLRSRTYVRRDPWVIDCVWWTQVVGISRPLPLNMLCPLSCEKLS